MIQPLIVFFYYVACFEVGAGPVRYHVDYLGGNFVGIVDMVGIGLELSLLQLWNVTNQLILAIGITIYLFPLELTFSILSWISPQLASWLVGVAFGIEWRAIMGL
ncbi:hypothetical protein ACJX0J_024014, partial [Zea mays]